MYTGIINVKKEAGFTSRDAVSKLSGILHQKKIGHTGTLDPEATGVLPMCLGSATRISELLMQDQKEYQAVMKLGIVTDTQDTTGVVLQQTELAEDDFCRITSEEALQPLIAGFIGEQDQLPPMYSAKRVGGVRLYDLAREGKTVERKPARIEIFSIDVTGVDPVAQTISLTVCCSKGTYIRTLIHDLGEKMGCGAAMASLVRTRSGMFRIDDAHTLSEIEAARDVGTLSELILPTDLALTRYQKLQVLPEGVHYLMNGNPLREELCTLAAEEGTEKDGFLPDACYRVYDAEGLFRAVYRYQASAKNFVPVKMFL